MKRKKLPNDASVLATFVLPIAKALRLLGADPMELLERAEIDPAHLLNADRRVPGEKLDTLLELSLAETGEPTFGLLAAEQLTPAALHGLGLSCLASDTVLDVLHRLSRFSHVLSTGVELKVVERDDFVDLEFHTTEYAREDVIHYTSLDFGMGMVMVMCRLTLGEYVSPRSVDTTRPEPEDADAFVSLLGAQTNFGADFDRITFVRVDIVDQLLTANPELTRVNDELVENYLASFEDVSTSREVVGRIVEQLPDGSPSQKQIAAALNVSNRTLQRKLQDEGTSFVDLLQDVRLQLALKYLSQPDRSVVETAYMLGFSEPSTFSRAFKRWTGQAPADYRRSLEETV